MRGAGKEVETVLAAFTSKSPAEAGCHREKTTNSCLFVFIPLRKVATEDGFVVKFSRENHHRRTLRRLSLDGHPERPLRIIDSLEFLRHQTELPIDWAEPGQVSDAQILRAHSAEHLSV